MGHKYIVDTHKFKVALSDKKRPDPIRVTVISKKRGQASHHLTGKEAQRLAFALTKAQGIADAMKKL